MASAAVDADGKEGALAAPCREGPALQVARTIRGEDNVLSPAVIWPVPDQWDEPGHNDRCEFPLPAS